MLAAVLSICSKDRTAPVISFNGKNTLTYTEGDSYDVLLEGLTAEDDVDGDVTDTIRISNIHPVGKGKAVVIYVAKDSANNIGKLKREVKYKEKETTVNGNKQTLPVNAGIEGAINGN